MPDPSPGDAIWTAPDEGQTAPTPLGGRQLDQTRFSAARLLAVEMYPFLAPALFALTVRSAPGLNTFGVTDRMVLLIDPDVLATWEIHDVAGVLLHEVGHVVRCHGERRRAARIVWAHRHLWNYACDAEINDDLVADGIPLPEHVVTPEVLDEPSGKSAEYYFRSLLDREFPRLEWHRSCGSGVVGSAGEAGMGSHADEDDTPGEAVASSQQQGLSDAELVAIRMQVAAKILQSGLKPGSIGGGWQRWAKATISPKIPWRQELRSCVRAAIAYETGLVHATYRTRSRRQFPDVILPGWRKPVPEIAIVIDTSASMASSTLEQAWSECLSCATAHGVRRDRVRVWAGDTTMRAVTALTDEVCLIGGGGTDMARAVEMVAVTRPRPDLIIVLTDGLTGWPSVAPRSTVIAVILEQDGPMPQAPPSWIRTIWVRNGV